MGRPKTYDQSSAARLVDAAEALADAGGPGAVSVRAVAERSGTTTRAVYSVFGSKAGLIAALGVRMFDLLAEGVAALPETDDPTADLVDAGVDVFRHLSVTRPSLYWIGVQDLTLDAEVAAGFVPAAQGAWQLLEHRFGRLLDAGGLPGQTPTSAARHFDALCEGLAIMERRGALAPETAEGEWRQALSSLLAGMARQG